MKFQQRLLLGALPVIFAACATSDVPRAALESLVQAEISFAQTSVSKGIREAFLSFLADSAIVFRPHPTNGLAAYRERPNPPLTLDWRPIYADVSASGDFGYTTGPWQITDNGPQKRPPAYGNYFSVWQKQARGDWKVIIDLGISHPEQKDLPRTWKSPAAQPIAAHVNGAGDIMQEKSALLQEERAFAAAAQAQGIEQAYHSHLAGEARLLRMGEFPFTDSRAIGAKLAERRGQAFWQPLRVEMAPSLDIAYTMGPYEFRPENAAAPLEKGYYVRVWKKPHEDTWKIVLDVETPLPPE